ncbi:uncharacterized protein JN550_005521 [Neoarthrinium moseri]|uniref:uncharacterized protein n=1 Tax=Neoarthrinium moseri TaxID=1658444 RepID=UPI001FDDF017|nr:uncharacterized protein JN550_005521 [Neoarthrinium moseri]KAI1869931.1 hypothetical protein JN550_005521 [Neoarthrinium moseri]
MVGPLNQREKPLARVCPPSEDIPKPVKVASSQVVLASSGAFQNLTQLLPPSLATYVNATIDQISGAFAGSHEYLAAQGLSPTVVYSTLACAALAVPIGMSRYVGGWAGRDGLSPYQDSNGVHVTDEDFSYITSEDLEQTLEPPSRAYDPRRQPPVSAKPEDDVLLIKNKGITYPVHFPAYSIGDGKLYVRDVRDRVGIVMEISTSRRRRIKMLYKGRQLKDQDLPIREYNVKNNSEILVVLPDGASSEDDSESSEEVIVPDPRGEQPSKSKNKKKRKSKKNRSPRDSAATLDVPGADGKGSSNEDSRHPSRIPSPAVPNGPLEKLDTIKSHFNTKLLPLCVEFSANPPKDKKKCEDEHRKLSETVMQQVLLKLDEVDTGGDPEIRAKRKQLVNMVHDVLKGIDSHLPEGSTRPSY